MVDYSRVRPALHAIFDGWDSPDTDASVVIEFLRGICNDRDSSVVLMADGKPIDPYLVMFNEGKRDVFLAIMHELINPVENPATTETNDDPSTTH